MLPVAGSGQPGEQGTCGLGVPEGVVVVPMLELRGSLPGPAWTVAHPTGCIGGPRSRAVVRGRSSTPLVPVEPAAAIIHGGVPSASDRFYALAQGLQLHVLLGKGSTATRRALGIAIIGTNAMA